MNALLASKWILESNRRPGASGSRVVTREPNRRAAPITMFLRDDNGTCYCMTSGHFISEGEICYLPRNSDTMNKLTNDSKVHLVHKNRYLKLGECVLSINEVPDCIRSLDKDLLGKIDVALIKVYDDVEQHLHLILRDERNTKTRVVVGVPDEDLEVKHHKYGTVNRGKITSVDSTHGIFYITPSSSVHEPPEGDRGALISKCDNDADETKVYGMLIAYEQVGDHSYKPVALQMDEIIERVQREMNERASGMRVYTPYSL